jgi:hypothetical protein
VNLTQFKCNAEELARDSHQIALSRRNSGLCRRVPAPTSRDPALLSNGPRQAVSAIVTKCRLDKVRVKGVRW